MSNDDLYRFNLVDGQVTNLQELEDGRWKNERIDRNESWSFDGTTLIKTETEKGRTKTSTFTDADGDGVFAPFGRDSVTGLPQSPSGAGTRIPEDSYRFSLVDGQVTNLQEFDDGRWKNERIDRNESWSFDGTNLIQQEVKRYGTEVTTFSDPDGDGIFSKTGKTVNGIAEDSYRFSLVDGQVTNLQEFDDGRWKNERIDRNESWSFDGTNLIQQEVKRYGTEVTTFSDLDGDGIFSKVSEVFNPLIAASNASMY